MQSYRITATVSDQGTLLLQDVPFSPGERLEVLLKPHPDNGGLESGEGADAPAHAADDADGATSDELDAWYQRLQNLGPARFGPGELEEFQHTLDEAHALSKEQVRRQMGLP